MIATKIQAQMLDAISSLLDGNPAAALSRVEPATLKLIKDAQDRGLGAPKASVDIQNPDGSLSNRDALQALVVEHLKKLHAGAKPKRA